MSKYEDDAMELIQMVAKNNYHIAAKPFGRGAMLKRQLIDTKSVETGMILSESTKWQKSRISY